MQRQTHLAVLSVLGPANASSFATLPVSHSSVYSVATHTCAYRDSSQLKVEPCDANNYDYLCMTLRGNQYCVRKLLCFLISRGLCFILKGRATDAHTGDFLWKFRAE